MPDPLRKGAARDRIGRFLADYPDGDLWVFVAYASAAGVAWLHTVSHGRRVRLLIGDTRTGWKNMTPEDRHSAKAFLNRPDTETRNWYRTNKSQHGPRAAHLKLWAVFPPDDSRPGVLNGSANLTDQGLDANVELMAEPADSDAGQAVELARCLWSEAWPAQGHVLKYLAEERPPPRPAQPAAPKEPSTRPAGSDPSPEQGRPRRRVTPVAAAVVVLVWLLVMAVAFASLNSVLAMAADLAAENGAAHPPAGFTASPLSAAGRP